MYHAIVKRIARKNFERINQKDFESLANDCAPNVQHRFGGNHALGGERHDREALRRWLGRLGRLGPDLKLTVHDVWVKGLPHNTIIIVRWSATIPFQTAPHIAITEFTSFACAGERSWRLTQTKIRKRWQSRQR